MGEDENDRKYRSWQRNDISKEELDAIKGRIFDLRGEIARDESDNYETFKRRTLLILKHTLLNLPSKERIVQAVNEVKMENPYVDVKPKKEELEMQHTKLLGGMWN